MRTPRGVDGLQGKLYRINRLIRIYILLFAIPFIGVFIHVRRLGSVFFVFHIFVVDIFVIYGVKIVDITLLIIDLSPVSIPRCLFIGAGRHAPYQQHNQTKPHR